MPSKPLTKEQIEQNIVIDKRGCWIWQGPFLNSGYGYKGRFSNLVHKCAYILWKGDYDRSLQIEHRCSNKTCCNPDHLNPVPRSMNTMKAYVEKHKQMPWKHLRVAIWVHNRVGDADLRIRM